MSSNTDIERLQTLVNLLVLEDNNKAEVMRQMGITSRQTIYDMLARANKLGVVPTVQPPSVKAAVTQAKMEYEDKVRDLQLQLKTVNQDQLTAANIRSYYFGLTNHPHTVPNWTVDLSAPSTSVGVSFDFSGGAPTEITGSLGPIFSESSETLTPNLLIVIV